MRRKRRRGAEGTQGGEEEQNLSAPEGACPPRKRAQTFLTFPPTGHTCCCRESMDNTLITMIGCTWTDQYRMTLYDSIVGAVRPRNRPTGMSHPHEQWGAGLQ